MGVRSACARMGLFEWSIHFIVRMTISGEAVSHARRPDARIVHCKSRALLDIVSPSIKVYRLSVRPWQCTQYSGTAQ